MPQVSKKKEIIKETLTTAEVQETLYMMDYFDSYATGYRTTNPLYQTVRGYYTPDLVNRSMQDVNNNPSIPTKVKLEEALANPKISEQILRNYATHFEINNMFYKRLVNFNADLLAWNLSFDVPNATTQDMKSKEFKEDLAVIDDFLGRFNPKDGFHAIVKQILRQGVYYGVLRDDGTKYAFQELPPDYCKITGRSTVGGLFAFNFAYFINRAGTDINMFPKVFKKLLNKIYKQMGDEYDPAQNPMRRHSSYAYWIDVSPTDNFFSFCVDDTVTTLIPYYSALFPEMLIQPIMRKLEEDKAMVAAHKLLVGILDTYEKNKNNTVNNQFTLNPKDIGKFLSVARGALDKSIGLAMLPVKQAQVVDFNVEAQNRYSTYNKTMASTSASSSAPLLAEDKLNSYESKLALTIDANFVKSLYKQFENLLDYYVNKNTKKFRFKFTFNDINTPEDQESRMNTFKTMAGMGLVDMNLYARAMDKNLFEASRGLKWAKVMGLEDDLIPLMSLNNQSGQEEGGRPSDDNSTNDNTVASKDAGSNDLADN